MTQWLYFNGSMLVFSRNRTPQYKMPFLRFFEFHSSKMGCRSKKMGKTTLSVLKNSIFPKKVTKNVKLEIYTILGNGNFEHLRKEKNDK